MKMKTRTKTAHYFQNKHKNPHTRTLEILPAHRYLKKGRLCGFTAHMATLSLHPWAMTKHRLYHSGVFYDILLSSQHSNIFQILVFVTQTKHFVYYHGILSNPGNVHLTKAFPSSGFLGLG